MQDMATFPTTTSSPMPAIPYSKKRTTGLDKAELEEVLRDALNSVLGGTGTRINPRVDFYSKFQREMEEHDRDFEMKNDEDLNTTLIFAGLFSAVASTFIIYIQSGLGPDYEQMNNTLLTMLLDSTAGNLSPDYPDLIPQWSGPDLATVQVQCILYASLFVTLLAAFLAMLGKQWLNCYRKNEVHGSGADKCRMRERKLTGVEAWKFDLVIQSLPLMLQCALFLFGLALSLYLWGVNYWVASVVIALTSLGFLFYVLIVTGSTSSDCPFQTPVSPLARIAVGSASSHWRTLVKALGFEQQPPEPVTPGLPNNLPFSANPMATGLQLTAAINTVTCMALGTTHFPRSVIPRFIQEIGAEGDRLDARCITRLLDLSIDADVVTSVMDFIPEVVWHDGIKHVPLKRIYDILMECFDFSGSPPLVIPKLRDVAYRSAKAFVHIALQRRCITRYEEQKSESWDAVCANHTLLSNLNHSSDSNLKAVLYMVDLTLGYQYPFLWSELSMTASHQAWMAHVFLYHAWHEGRLSEVVIDFVEHSGSTESPSDIVVADLLLIIGLMIDVPFHVSDIIVRDKSSEKEKILDGVIQTLSMIFSRPTQTQPALRALQLVTQLDICDAGYDLFKKIMACEYQTVQQWEASRLALSGAFRRVRPQFAEEPKDIVKYLDYHLGLHGEGGDHRPFIIPALEAIITWDPDTGRRIDPMAAECIRDLDCARPSFVKGVVSIMHPHNEFHVRVITAGVLAVACDQWFGSPQLVMEPEEMSEFCEYLAVLMIDDAFHDPFMQKCGVTILFGLLRSPEWRKCIVPRLWRFFAYCLQVEEDLGSSRWCLQNAMELLEFTRRLPDDEGLKWWYGVLWFYFDKLDPAVRGKVERIAKDMSSGDGVSVLRLYLNLIGQQIAEIRQEVETLTREDERMAGLCIAMRHRLVVLEGNHRRLARITNEQ